MKRNILFVFLCVAMIFAVCSAAIGAFRMNAESFTQFCRNASAAEVRRALKAGADMDVSAWYTAAEKNPDPQVLEVLLEEGRKSGVDLLNMKSGSGRTALMLAAGRGNPSPEPAKFLINAGADVNIKDGNWTALEYARAAEDSGYPRREVIEMIVRKMH